MLLTLSTLSTAPCTPHGMPSALGLCTSYSPSQGMLMQSAGFIGVDEGKCRPTERVEGAAVGSGRRSGWQTISFILNGECCQMIVMVCQRLLAHASNLPPPPPCIFASIYSNTPPRNQNPNQCLPLEVPTGTLSFTATTPHKHTHSTHWWVGAFAPAAPEAMRDTHRHCVPHRHYRAGCGR